MCLVLKFLGQLPLYKKRFIFAFPIIIILKFLKKNTNHNMSFSGFYVDYSTIVSQQYSMQNMTNEYWKIVEINKQLEEKNRELKKKIDSLQSETLYKKKQINELRKIIMKKDKRKYSKRRIWLQKKFTCQYDGCQNKYSSQVALNCHIKKKHMETSQYSF